MTPESGDRRRHFAGSQNGFTLVEMLTTMVMIGILAAIALPNFLGQRKDAADASAKALAHSGALALQTYAVEHEGYGASRAELLALAPELDDAQKWSLAATATDYTLTVTAGDDHTFTVQRSLTGAAQRTCTIPGAGGCTPSGTW
jgi:type IV pilus assembly protein PilA